MTRIFSIFLLLLAQQAIAFDFSIPESAILVDEAQKEGIFSLPRGRYTLNARPSADVNGALSRKAWRVESSNNVEPIIRTMIGAYERQGFELAFECVADNCGGFDFRHAIDTSPEPDFKVNLSNFHYANLVDGQRSISILISAIGAESYIQQDYIEPTITTRIPLTTEPAVTPPEESPESFPSTADNPSRQIISSARFEVGKSSLASIEEDELAAIATHLQESPELTAYIVGHSDQSGSLSANLSISKARAQSVVNALVENHDVSRERVTAQGVGFLAPIADNSTEEGREKNRRVEVVYLVN